MNTATFNIIIALLWLCLVPRRVLSQETIVLRPVARIAADSAVMLGDIATISGARTAELQSVVLPACHIGDDIEPAAIRKVLDEAFAAGKFGMHSGTIAISGSRCRIMARKEIDGASASTDPALSPHDGTLAQTPNQPDRPSAGGDDQTVRGMLTGRLLSTFGVGAHEARISFDERDRGMLDESTHGRAITISTVGGGERLAYEIRIYETERLVKQATIRVAAQIRRRVAVAAATIERDTPLTTHDISVQEQWCSHTLRPLPPDTVEGRTARSRISIGDVIEERDVATISTCIKRGDIVMLDSVNAGIAVRTTARALSGGSPGDVIVFETMQWHTRVTGKISGNGHAVALGPAGSDGSGSRPQRTQAPRTPRATQNTSPAAKLAQAPRSSTPHLLNTAKLPAAAETPAKLSTKKGTP